MPPHSRFRCTDRAAAQAPNQPGKSSSQPKTALPVPASSVNTTTGSSASPSSSASACQAVTAARNAVTGIAASSTNSPLCAGIGEVNTAKFALNRVFRHSLTASAHCCAPARNVRCNTNRSTRYPTASASVTPRRAAFGSGARCSASHTGHSAAVPSHTQTGSASANAPFKAASRPNASNSKISKSTAVSSTGCATAPVRGSSTRSINTSPVSGSAVLRRVMVRSRFTAV